MSPKRTKVIKLMVKNWYGALKSDGTSNISLKEYLEGIGLKDDELAYGLGVGKDGR